MPSEKLAPQWGGGAAAAVERYPSSSSGVLGTGSALPRTVVTNDDLAGVIDTTDEWITERVGVQSRHVADPSESTVSLAHAASVAALEAANVEASEIDLIVLATATPDQSLPSSASLLHQRLGNPRAMSFDVRAACTGFLFGLATVDALQKIQGFKKALVVGSEVLSRIVDWSDRQTCVLFGDGAGAVVYVADRSCEDENQDEVCGVLAVDLRTDADLTDLICRPGSAFPPATIPETLLESERDGLSPYVHMKGKEVFKTGVSAMYDSMKRVLEKTHCSIDDVDLFVPHQSNKRMIDAVCDKIRLDQDKLAFNLDRVGNTSAASIPIALDEAVRAGRVKKGDLILMTAVGAGITYGATLLRW